MKTSAMISFVAVVAAGALLTGCGGSSSAQKASSETPASAAAAQGAVMIRHQVQGCHSWSVNGGAFSTSPTLSLARGGSMVVSNNDIMPHELVQTAGQPVTFVRVQTPMSDQMVGLKGTFGPAMMAHMGAATEVAFPAAGTYRFTTKAGEDYPMAGQMMEETGEDNVLELTVNVS